MFTYLYTAWHVLKHLIGEMVFWYQFQLTALHVASPRFAFTNPKLSVLIYA